MPCTDPRDVKSISDAFDLTTPDVLQWELELIWKAVHLELLVISPHARIAAKDDAIPQAAIRRIVHDGFPRSKDITAEKDRKIGINFEGKRRGGGWVRAKVTWRDGYTVVTVHAV